MPQNGTGKKILIFRLSSLGDVILSAAALTALPQGEKADWVVCPEYAPLLRHHPRIHQLWEFDRKTGLRGWLKLCRTISAEGYTEILDLHGSLRTRLAKWLIFALKAKTGRMGWKTVPKERWRLYGFFIFKRFWPRRLRPRVWTERYSGMVADGVAGKPDFSHLRKPELPFNQKGPFLCVMPSSLWQGKKWPVSRYVEVISRTKAFAVVLGTKSDRESAMLAKALEEEKLPYISGVGQWDLPTVANVLSHSSGYLGGDTGLAHLAEAMGTRAWVVFGPTVPEMGFGPWRKESRSFGSSLWCRPCGKDGRFCFRLTNRYRCLNDLSPDGPVHEFGAGTKPRAGAEASL